MEVLDLVDKKATVNIELKGDNVEKPVVDLITEYNPKVGIMTFLSFPRLILLNLKR